MTRRRLVSALVLAAALLAPPLQAAEQIWINDILVNPSRYWNTTVTVSGQVMAATPNPAGTTRGLYTLQDESNPGGIAVRTDDLPALGKSFTVSGVVIQDPAQANVPLIREVSRTTPGMSSLIRYLLIGGAILFLALLVVFLVMLLKPKPRPAPAPAPTVRPTPSPVTMRPTPAPPAAGKATVKVPSPTGAAPAHDDKTKVFMNLGAALVVDRGPEAGKEYPLHKPVTTLGRAGSRKNDIELDDETVSKQQATIYYDGASSAFTIANESTTNPTSVNRGVITEPTLLEPDAVIEMGATALRFRRG